jgi:hypothetical protein
VDLVPPIPSHCLILHENTSHPRQMTLSWGVSTQTHTDNVHLPTNVQY